MVAALEALELLLREGSVEPEAMAAWRQGFDAALATAERGAGWADTTARARALAGQLDGAIKILADQRDDLRKGMDLQAQGVRALRGYRPS